MTREYRERRPYLRLGGALAAVIGLGLSACSKSMPVEASPCAQHMQALQTIAAVPPHLRDLPASKAYYCQAAELHGLIHRREAERQHQNLLAKDVAHPPVGVDRNELQKIYDESAAKLTKVEAELAAKRASSSPELGTDAGVRHALSAYFHRELAIDAAAVIAACQADENAFSEAALRHYLVGITLSLQEDSIDGLETAHGVFLRHVVAEVRKGCP